MQNPTTTDLMAECMQINKELEFLDWAKSNSYDCSIGADGNFSAPATLAACAGYEAAYRQHANTRKGQPVYAEIKQSSKYAHQISMCRTDPCGYPFKVSFSDDACGYVVKGGIGGQYRLDDVTLFVIEHGNKIKLN